MHLIARLNPRQPRNEEGPVKVSKKARMLRSSLVATLSVAGMLCAGTMYMDSLYLTDIRVALQLSQSAK